MKEKLTWRSGKTRGAGLHILSSNSSSSHIFVISVIKECNLNTLYEEEQDEKINYHCSKWHLGQWLKRNCIVSWWEFESKQGHVILKQAIDSYVLRDFV